MFAQKAPGSAGGHHHFAPAKHKLTSPFVPLPAALLLLTLTCCTTTPVAAPHPADEPALLALNNTFHPLQSINTLQTDFLCRKDLVDFDTPLLTSGTLIAARPDLYRFSTLKPYLSEIMQQGTKVFRKTQHETTWDKSDLQ